MRTRSVFPAVVILCCGCISLALGQTPLTSGAASSGRADCTSFPIGKDDVVVILGDSIGGPARIADMMRKECPERGIWVINASLGGNIIRDALGRLERDALRSDLPGGADVGWYVIMFGANDSGQLKPAQYEEYYREIIRRLKRRTRAAVILVGAPAFTLDSKYHQDASKRIGEFLDVARKLGREYGLATVDLFNPSLQFAKEHGGAAFAKDGIHPTPEGHVLMAETFLRQFSFFALSEIVDVDPAAGKATGTAGCDAAVSADGGVQQVRLRNLYDFPRRVGVRIAGAAQFDIYDPAGRKLAPADGRVVVELPCRFRLLSEDVTEIRRIAKPPAMAGIDKLAAQIEAKMEAGRTLTLRLVGAGGAAPAALKDSTGEVPLWRDAAALFKAAQALPAGKEADRVKELAGAFLDQMVDLRVNFPTERLKRGQGGCRDGWGIGRAGEAATHFKETFEALLINHDGPPLKGSIAIGSMPPRGWAAKPATPAEFADVQPGAAFVTTFDLTGEPVASCEGTMTVTARWEVDGLKRTKQVPIELFAPWLGIGTFCDTEGRAKASLADKFAVAYGPEKELNPAAACQRFDGKSLTWVPFRSLVGLPGIERVGQVAWTGEINGGKGAVFAPWQPPGVIYIARYVYSPEDRDVRLHPVFTSRAARLWLNGKVVLDRINPDEKEWHQDKFGMNWSAWLKTDFYDCTKTVDARLSKGWNTVLLKLVSSARAWNDQDLFDLRILDAEGKVMRDLLGACVAPE